MDKLIKDIILWGAERGILGEECRDKQIIKIVEEVGELSSAHLKDNYFKTVDSIGDILVTLIIYSAQNNLPIQQCLEVAYNEIKDRQGRTIKGTFIKNEEIRK